MSISSMSSAQNHAIEIERRFTAKLQREKWRSSLLRILLNIAGVAGFLFQGGSPRILSGTNVQLFPPPSFVLKTAWPMIISGELLENIAVSLARASSCFLIAWSLRSSSAWSWPECGLYVSSASRFCTDFVRSLS